jgi:ABC-type branched-subunit amino acid transport system permease subunit
LSSAGYQSALVIIGALLVLIMTFFPGGIVVTLARSLPKRGTRPVTKSKA